MIIFVAQQLAALDSGQKAALSSEPERWRTLRKGNTFCSRSWRGYLIRRGVERQN
jgi:hypothetical protein